MEKSEGGDFPPKKSQSETAGSLSAGTDFPAKKLARQLDFTGYTGGTSPAAAAASSSATATATATTVALGERTLQRQPPPQAAFRPSLPQTQPQVSRPTQPPKPQPQPQQQHPIPLTTMQQPPLPPATHPPIRPIKPESPRPRPRSNANEVKDGTPKKQKQCNCKHSRCLKLYCECFASGIYCDGCNCVNCFNNVENEGARREAVENTLERNPNAFRPKIASSPHGVRDSREEPGDGLVLAKHNKGCHCKKSGCLKKYCECFQANILCSENCKCFDCKNFEGSEERQALFHGDHANSIAYIQQAANAAITGAIGSSGFGSPPVNKKRKGQELFFGSTIKDPLSRMGQFQQANHMKTAVSPSLSSVPGTRAGNPAGVGPSKFTYRSLLADIIQPQDLKELCSVLVVYSAEAAKMIADERNATNRPTQEQRETHFGSTRDQSQGHEDSGVAEKASVEDCLHENQAEKIGTDESVSDSADLSKNRPMSPGTLALMCDEHDTMFTAAASPTGLTGQSNITCQLPHGQGITEAYAEQERIVLTKFRDCLNKLITLGEIKETKCSSFARSETSNQRDHLVSNGGANVKIDTWNKQEHSSNGVPKSAIPPPPRTSQMVTPAGTATSDQIQKIPSVENGDIKSKTEKAM